MKLQYGINTIYDYESKSCVIILSSEYLEKEYPCSSIANLSAMLGVAIEDFNKQHAEKIQELDDEERYKAYEVKQKQKAYDGKASSKT